MLSFSARSASSNSMAVISAGRAEETRSMKAGSNAIAVIGLILMRELIGNIAGMVALSPAEAAASSAASGWPGRASIRQPAEAPAWM